MTFKSSTFKHFWYTVTSSVAVSVKHDKHKCRQNQASMSSADDLLLLMQNQLSSWLSEQSNQRLGLQAPGPVRKWVKQTGWTGETGGVERSLGAEWKTSPFSFLGHQILLFCQKLLSVQSGADVSYSVTATCSPTWTVTQTPWHHNLNETCAAMCQF